MTLPDFINGCFEGTAGFAILDNCRCAWQSGKIVGVSWFSTAFFTLWGCWNVLFYPMVGQWFSASCGVFVMLANVVWLSLIIRSGLRA